MPDISVKIPGVGDVDGETPIVILGPNGSGKTRLAQKIAEANPVSAISAQRRTWLDDNLPVQNEEQLQNNIRNHIDRWESQSLIRSRDPKGDALAILGEKIEASLIAYLPARVS